jgi:hypothetical protein
MLNPKVWAWGLGIAAVSFSGLALADINTDRLHHASDCADKAILLLTAIVPANNAESKQIAKAKKQFAAAQKTLQCAILREQNPKAACP